MTVEELQKKLRTLLAGREMNPQIKARILAVTDLRPLRVIAHIVEHGSVSTEELATKYGYLQPPRAARDVRERGIHLVSKSGRTRDGRRRMAIYELAEGVDPGANRSGRSPFTKQIKKNLLERFEGRCAICLGRFANGLLQVDHRIPYEIAGEIPDEKQDHTTLMLVCNSCNRSKSWECEHCPNWAKRNPRVCRSCYWASPLDYSHAAMVEMRRETITWTGQEVEKYDAAKRSAGKMGKRVGDLIKEFVASRT